MHCARGEKAVNWNSRIGDTPIGEHQDTGSARYVCSRFLTKRLKCNLKRRCFRIVSRINDLNLQARLIQRQDRFKLALRQDR